MRINLVQPIHLVGASEGDGAKRRTIDGIAVPYGVPANASTGPVMFEAGSLPTDGPAPKLLRNHDPADPVGIVTERVSTDTEMLFSARISETSAGNEALVLAADGVYDGVSVGVDIIRHRFEDGVMVVEAGEWRELSLVTFPAFAEARILDVAATEAEEIVESSPMEELEEDPEPTTTETEEVSAMAQIEAATSPTAPLQFGGALTRPRVTAGEYISAMLTGRPLPQIQAADNVLSDIPGLLPEPLLGDVWSSYFSGRPIIDAVGTRAMPAGGETFYRRYIAQTTAVAQQMAEYDNLASQQFEVSRLQFDKKTFGGYLNISAQGDWAEPALVQQIINDMVRQYSIATEAYVGGRVSNAASAGNTPITDPTDGDEVIAALYDGAAQLRDATGVLPTHLMVSTSVWAKFGQAKDAGGNRIFPYLGPSNAAGTAAGVTSLTMNPLGLSLVVTNDLGAGDQAMLVYGPAVEVYEDRSRTGGIRVENPATASATLGLWGYLAADVLPPLTGGGSYVISLI